ncbi:MAG: SusC/RagA family TonB-linked outer membrane protein [Breznakibacter sp.]
MNKKSKLRKLLLVAMGLICMIGIQAQQRTITGNVKDAADGSALPGVSVVVKNTTQGTITSFNGDFSIEAEQGRTLVFSFIGYKPQEVTIDGTTTFNIRLEQDIQGVEEVVVIGYGVSKKKDLTGAVQTVSVKDFNQGAITSPQQLVNGKIAGVQIVDAGGAPGAKSTIRIRGGSSINASNDPLIIIDGVPIANGDISGSRNPLDIVNPNDIETFTVLKDASATAIYGSRASNGVILITTKKGTGSKLTIDYTGNVSMATVAKTVDMLNADEYRTLFNQKFPSNTNLLGQASTDWQDEIYENAISTDHNLSFAGNIKNVLPFRASAGYNISNGILKESQMKRTNVALNLNPSFFEDHLRINISGKGMFSQNNFSNEGAIGSAIRMDPTKPVTAEGYEDFGGYYTWTQAGIPNSLAPKNPVAQINQSSDKSKVNRFIGNFQADYKFHFLPDLRANLNLGMDYSKGEDDGNKPIPVDAGWDTESFVREGAYSMYTQKKRNELLDFYLQYTKNLDQIKSRIDVMGGYSWQHFWQQNENASFFNTEVNGSDVRDPYKLTKSENYLVSFFGRVNYTFNSKYYMTFTLRNDGSSRFSEDNRWGLFPSLALAWNVKDESFLQNVSMLTNLKLRLGYGITGQQDIGSEYGYFGIYERGEASAAYVFYNPETGAYDRVMINTIRPAGYDANLKWEETTTYNAAIDYGYWNDRVTGSVDVYFRETKDILNVIPVPAGANLTNQLLTNVGNMENKGIEFSTNVVAVNGKDWKWEIGGNFTYNKNEITKLTAVNDPNYLGVQHGGIDGGTGNTVKIHQVGAPAGSFFVKEQVYDANGRPVEGMYVDRNKDGVDNEADLYVAGNAAPKYIIGFNTSVSYKNWEFNAAARANLDFQLYNNIASNNAFYNQMQTTSSFASNIHSDIYNTGFTNPQYFSDYYVQDGSFLRLDNIMLGYNFNNLGIAKMRMKLYGTINNVFTITKYDGVDPEVFDGIDNKLYPRPRTFMLGVNLSF